MRDAEARRTVNISARRQQLVKTVEASPGKFKPSSIGPHLSIANTSQAIDKNRHPEHALAHRALEGHLLL